MWVYTQREFLGHADIFRTACPAGPVSYQAASDAADSPCVERLLECMAPGVSYSAVQLLTLLGLKSRQTLRMHYLDPAIQEGLVEMTIPEKPSSRNQRYRRTQILCDIKWAEKP